MKGIIGIFAIAMAVFSFSGCDILTRNNNNVLSEHTVTFCTSGGTEIPPITVSHNTQAARPSDPARTHNGAPLFSWHFLGWDWDFSNPVIDNITITARWQETHLQSAIVSRVIDGDTIDVEFTINEQRERVRFIGIDTPEIGEPGADEATQFVREKIDGQTVWLEADGNNRDAFNRLRRYIWLRLPPDPMDEIYIRQYMLNALLLSNGLARTLIIGNPRNAELFLLLESEARN